MTDHNWQPKTKDDAWACWFYDDDTISAIADVLPRDVDRGVLTGSIRQWASRHVAIVRRESPDTAAGVRTKLKRAAAKLREATVALDEVPDIAKAQMADLRSEGDSAGLKDWARDMDYVRSARELREMAALADRVAKLMKVERRRPPDDHLKLATSELGLIYNRVTGRRPTRVVADNRDVGPFQAFVEAALKPLWPKAGRAGRNVKTAVSLWHKSQQAAPQ